jgi:gamma-glutamylcyclotransferase (GGCT)/AIG2-like uncharacterized protein YtfP
MLDRLFTYGTLMPGHLRWRMLEARAARWVRATADGVLYDTGNGWPAATFGGSSAVPGWVVTFPTGVLGELLPGLDAMEGIGAGRGTDPYVRRVVGTSAGDAWAYDATVVGPGWVVIDSWVGRPEA